jgi:hypothetical protein
MSTAALIGPEQAGIARDHHEMAKNVRECLYVMTVNAGAS